MAGAWCKVASNLDSHPKIRKAGRLGREVFLFALRLNADPANPVPGIVPAVMLEDWYVAEQLMMTVTESNEGLLRVLSAGLLKKRGASFEIVGWDDDWGRRPKSNAERQADFRTKQRNRTATGEHKTPSVTEPSLRRNANNESNGSEEIRGDQIRREEKREEGECEREVAADAARVSAPDSSLLAEFKRKVDAMPAQRPKKPKPPAASQAELASVRIVLEKLGSRNGVAYSGSVEHVKLIVDRLRDGYTELDLRKVVAHKADEWESDDKMRRHLCPETLFGPRTIQRYIDAARTAYKHVETAEPQQVSQ
jgi:uncharacterized phage protein (TIGR02220 family)